MNSMTDPADLLEKQQKQLDDTIVEIDAWKDDMDLPAPLRGLSKIITSNLKNIKRDSRNKAVNKLTYASLQGNVAHVRAMLAATPETLAKLEKTLKTLGNIATLPEVPVFAAPQTEGDERSAQDFVARLAAALNITDPNVVAHPAENTAAVTQTTVAQTVTTETTLAQTTTVETAAPEMPVAETPAAETAATETVATETPAAPQGPYAAARTEVLDTYDVAALLLERMKKDGWAEYDAMSAQLKAARTEQQKFTAPAGTPDTVAFLDETGALTEAYTRILTEAGVIYKQGNATAPKDGGIYAIALPNRLYMWTGAQFANFKGLMDTVNESLLAYDTVLEHRFAEESHAQRIAQIAADRDAIVDVRILPSLRASAADLREAGHPQIPTDQQLQDMIRKLNPTLQGAVNLSFGLRVIGNQPQDIRDRLSAQSLIALMKEDNKPEAEVDLTDEQQAQIDNLKNADDVTSFLRANKDSLNYAQILNIGDLARRDAAVYLPEEQPMEETSTEIDANAPMEDAPKIARDAQRAANAKDPLKALDALAASTRDYVAQAGNVNSILSKYLDTSEAMDSFRQGTTLLAGSEATGPDATIQEFAAYRANLRNALITSGTAYLAGHANAQSRVLRSKDNTTENQADAQILEHFEQSYFALADDFDTYMNAHALTNNAFRQRLNAVTGSLMHALKARRLNALGGQQIALVTRHVRDTLRVRPDAAEIVAGLEFAQTAAAKKKRARNAEEKAALKTRQNILDYAEQVVYAHNKGKTNQDAYQNLKASLNGMSATGAAILNPAEAKLPEFVLARNNTQRNPGEMSPAFLAALDGLTRENPSRKPATDDIDALLGKLSATIGKDEEEKDFPLFLLTGEAREEELRKRAARAERQAAAETAQPAEAAKNIAPEPALSEEDKLTRAALQEPKVKDKIRKSVAGILVGAGAKAMAATQAITKKAKATQAKLEETAADATPETKESETTRRKINRKTARSTLWASHVAVAAIRRSPVMLLSFGFGLATRGAIGLALGGAAGLALSFGVAGAPVIATAAIITTIGFMGTVVGGYLIGGINANLNNVYDRKIKEGFGTFSATRSAWRQTMNDLYSGKLSVAQVDGINHLWPIINQSFTNLREYDKTNNIGRFKRFIRPVRVFGEAMRIDRERFRLGLSSLVGAGIAGTTFGVAHAFDASLRPGAALPTDGTDSSTVASQGSAPAVVEKLMDRAPGLGDAPIAPQPAYTPSLQWPMLTPNGTQSIPGTLLDPYATWQIQPTGPQTGADMFKSMRDFDPFAARTPFKGWESMPQQPNTAVTETVIPKNPAPVAPETVIQPRPVHVETIHHPSQPAPVAEPVPLPKPKPVVHHDPETIKPRARVKATAPHDHQHHPVKARLPRVRATDAPQGISANEITINNLHAQGYNAWEETAGPNKGRIMFDRDGSVSRVYNGNNDGFSEPVKAVGRALSDFGNDISKGFKELFNGSADTAHIATPPAPPPHTFAGQFSKAFETRLVGHGGMTQHNYRILMDQVLHKNPNAIAGLQGWAREIVDQGGVSASEHKLLARLARMSTGTPRLTMR